MNCHNKKKKKKTQAGVTGSTYYDGPRDGLGLCEGEGRGGPRTRPRTGKDENVGPQSSTEPTPDLSVFGKGQPQGRVPRGTRLVVLELGKNKMEKRFIVNPLYSYFKTPTPTPTFPPHPLYLLILNPEPQPFL